MQEIKKPREVVRVLVNEDGVVVYIATDAFKVEHAGAREVQRAAHVEPFDELSEMAKSVYLENNCTKIAHRITCDDWFVDLTLLKGPVLGPYTTRKEALQVEAGWLATHVITPKRV